MSKFVYVIYDKVNGEVWESFLNEDLCIDRYNELYKGFVNMDWMGINIEFEVKRRIL